MNTRKLSITLAAGAMLFALALTTHADARGRGGRGPGGPPPRAGHSYGLLRQLIFPCGSACHDSARACHEAADNTALACVSDACSSEVGAAQAACAADHRSSDCREAVEALRDCADDCLDDRSTAVGACREALDDCVDACEDAQ